MGQFWEMYAVYASKDDNFLPMEETPWGRKVQNEEHSEKFELTLNGRRETFSEGAGAEFLSSCQKSVDIMEVGTFASIWRFWDAYESGATSKATTTAAAEIARIDLTRAPSTISTTSTASTRSKVDSIMSQREGSRHLLKR